MALADRGRARRTHAERCSRGAQAGRCLQSLIVLRKVLLAGGESSVLLLESCHMKPVLSCPGVKQEKGGESAGQDQGDDPDEQRPLPAEGRDRVAIGLTPG
jgi:hypothetical protein